MWTCARGRVGLAAHLPHRSRRIGVTFGLEGKRVEPRTLCFPTLTVAVGLCHIPLSTDLRQEWLRPPLGKLGVRRRRPVGGSVLGFSAARRAPDFVDDRPGDDCLKQLSTADTEDPAATLAPVVPVVPFQVGRESGEALCARARSALGHGHASWSDRFQPGRPVAASAPQRLRRARLGPRERTRGSRDADQGRARAGARLSPWPRAAGDSLPGRIRRSVSGRSPTHSLARSSSRGT